MPSSLAEPMIRECVGVWPILGCAEAAAIDHRDHSVKPVGALDFPLGLRPYPRYILRLSETEVT